MGREQYGSMQGELKMFSVWKFVFLSLLSIVISEWIEVKVVNKEIESSNYMHSTVPSYYEVIMKTPVWSTSVPPTISTQLLETEPVISSFKENTTKLRKDGNKPTNQAFIKPQGSNKKIDDSRDLGFLSFLNSVQHNLLDNNRKSISSKLNTLKQLRDHLLWEIRNRMANLWNPTAYSEARTYKEDDHHMDYPSNEGALMTIGFLTFAVFLIKLVLKLIYLIKHKKQYYYSTTTTTTAASVFLKKRDVSDHEPEKILQYIEDYKF